MQADTPPPSSPTVLATASDSPASTASEVDDMELATPHSAWPTPAVSPTSTVAPTKVSVSAEVQPTLPGGLRIGTPESGEPTNKDNAPPAQSGVIPTSPPSSFDSDNNGVLSTPELIAALRATYPTYNWPPGYIFDLETAIHGIEDQATRINSMYETGMERTMLGGAYQCAWLLTLLDAIYAGNDPLSAESLEQLRTQLASDPSMTEIRQFAEDALNSAELGDPGPLQTMIDINTCTTIPWTSGTPDAASILGTASIARLAENDNRQQLGQPIS